MTYQRDKIVLGNGLRVLLDRRQSCESVSITCLVGVGSQDDPATLSGLAHVVEHLLFRTKASNKESSLLKAIEDTGGTVAAFTNIDRTVYSIRVHGDDLSKAIYYLSRVICDLPEDEKSLVVERPVIEEELRSLGADNPYALQRNKYALLGGNESLKHYVGGSVATLKRITLKEAREFYEKYYVASNMVLALVGNFDRKMVVSMLEEQFGSVKKGFLKRKPFSLDNVGPKIKVTGVGANMIALFFRCPSYQDQNLATMEIVSSILSIGTNSILFQSLREKRGLIYALYSYLALSPDYSSSFPLLLCDRFVGCHV